MHGGFIDDELPCRIVWQQVSASQQRDLEHAEIVGIPTFISMVIWISFFHPYIPCPRPPAQPKDTSFARPAMRTPGSLFILVEQIDSPEKLTYPCKVIGHSGSPLC